jgi:Zn-dependent protease with chaperone function
MTFAYLLPSVLALAGLVLALSIHRGLPPAVAAFTLTGAIVATALTTIWSLALLAADVLLDRLGWCRDALHGHVHVPPALGAVALVAVLFGFASAIRSLTRRRRARLGPIPDGDLLVIEDETPMAFAVPGRHPHVVVSTGMLELLEYDERQAMLAHERAHLRHHHHRLITATEVAAAMLPPLRPAAARVRFATERWADRDAAVEVGDPYIVARAIGRAALARTATPVPALALSGSDVAARIDALMANQAVPQMDSAPFATVALMAVSFAAVVVQSHHLIEFVRTFCLP